MTSGQMSMRAVAHLLRTCELGATATFIGSQLWGKPYRQPQSYARPAGALLHRMHRLGIVTPPGRLWTLAAGWERALDAAAGSGAKRKGSEA